MAKYLDASGLENVWGKVKSKVPFEWDPSSGKVWRKGVADSSAIGNYSISIGNSKAVGTYSVAEGDGTIANANCSHTEGYMTFTQPQNVAEHAEGYLNISHTDGVSTFGSQNKTIHSVGINGKNAVEIMQNGDMYVYGIGGYEGTTIKSQNSDIKPIQGSVGTIIDDGEVSEHSCDILRNKDEFYAPAVSESTKHYTHTFNPSHGAQTGQANLTAELIAESPDKYVDVHVTNGYNVRGGYNAEIGSWWTVSGSETNSLHIYGCESGVAYPEIDKITLYVSAYFAINNQTGKVASDYPGTYIWASDGTFEQTYLRGYSVGDDPSDVEIVKFVIDDVDSYDKYVYVNPAGDNNYRFNLYRIEVEFEDGETSYIWNRLANASELDVIPTIQQRLDVIEPAVMNNTVRISAIETEFEEKIGDIKIVNRNYLPAATSEMVDTIIKYNGDLYQCKNVGHGTDKYYSFENLTADTNPLTASNYYNKFVSKVTNGFGDDFYWGYDAENVARVYCDNGGIHIGKSGSTGTLQLTSMSGDDITEIEFTLEAWADEKTGGIKINNGSESIVSDLVPQQVVVYPNTYSVVIDSLAYPTTSDARVRLIDGIRVRIGNPSYEWVPINLDPLTTQEILNVLVD